VFAKEGSSSFLKKRTKKILLCYVMRPARSARIPKNKSFLVLFFKKELLSAAFVFRDTFLWPKQEHNHSRPHDKTMVTA
jgi:hypothetical protein